MARILLENEEFCVTSTITGKFRVTMKSGAYSRKANKAESMHFHSIIDCLTLLGVPTEPRNELFKDAVSAFATSLLDESNTVYKDYFSTPPHEHVYRIVKKP
jgi:hypothetical protein